MFIGNPKQITKEAKDNFLKSFNWLYEQKAKRPETYKETIEELNKLKVV